MLNQRFHVAISRAKALETLYRPVLEAGHAELQETKSGAKLLAGAHAFAKELGESPSRKAHRKRDGLHNLNTFRQQYGEQLLATHAQQARFQPSPAHVAHVLYPEIPVTRWLFKKRAILGGTLLQAKVTGQDFGTATQGLGDPPPLLQSCITPPYDKQDIHGLPLSIPDGSQGGGTATPDGNTMAAGDASTNPFVPSAVYLASAFVGHDFAVPPGPTQYTTTISYDWSCSGQAGVGFGVAIVNVDLAIVVDKRDGTRETFAREVTLLTVPAFGFDSFSHQANDVTVTIPFARDGLNGTVTIWVGVDGQATVIGPFGGAWFQASAFVREICLTSVG